MKILMTLLFFITPVFAEEITIENFEAGTFNWDARVPLTKKKPEYTIEIEKGNHFLHAAPEKGVEGKIIYKRFSIDLKKTPRLKWRWRVTELPKNADEGVRGKNDSGAGVYIYIQKGILRRILKYCFSASHTGKEWMLAPSSNWMWKTKMKVLRTGAPLNEWVEEEVDIAKDFKEAYDTAPPARAEGIGILTDGDQTHSSPKADYDDFKLLPSTP